jgi:CheY-like chemotaxis protein
MISSFLIFLFVLALIAATVILSTQWEKYFQRVRKKHFVMAVNSAIALRFEHEFKTRTEALHKISEHRPSDSENPHYALPYRIQLNTLSKFTKDFSLLMQYQHNLKSLSLGEFSLDETIGQAVRKFSQQHQSHHGEIILRLPSEASHIFLGCRETVQELTIHLLESLWFRCAQGDIILGVEFDATKKRPQVRIVVSSALGASKPTRAEELFLPFTGSHTSKRGASLIELTLARHAAFLLGGILRATHREQGGMSLAALFPLTHVQQPQTVQLKAEFPDSAEKPATGKRILVVHSAISQIQSIKETLERWNNTVHLFSSGREALHHIRHQTPNSGRSVYDYLFIDESTEDFEYAVVMHYVLSNPHAFRHVVLIARRSPKVSQREPGVHGVLEKPITRESLAALLNCLENPPKEAQAEVSPKHSTMPIPDSSHAQQHVVPALDVQAEDLLKDIPEPQPKQKLLGLVVDDNLVNMHTVAGVLRQRSMDVLVAENGKDALEIFLQNSHTLDFILMDVQMPEMDGCEATKRIRAFERERETRIPIIALTAYAKKEDRKRCLEAGMDDFISKGATPEALFEKINLLLTKKTPGPSSDGISLDEPQPN